LLYALQKKATCVNINRFFQHPSLQENENRVYRNFNFVILFGLVDIFVVASVVRNLHPTWPFYFAISQFVILSLMLYLHLRGFFNTSRVFSFISTILIQVLASLTHGPSAGFDYVLLGIRVLPMLFFESRKFYLSLFVIGLLAHLFVKFEYENFKPLMQIDSDFPMYWNVVFTGCLVFGTLYIFKRSYQSSQEILTKKNEDVSRQKEEIASINDSLSLLVDQRTKRVKEHEALLVDFANINAHRVRSPLARILGLLNLAELEEDKSKVTNDFVPLIKENAKELNDILVVAGKKLNSLQEEDKPEGT
jgi:signal transduction histidine kinase